MSSSVSREAPETCLTWTRSAALIPASRSGVRDTLELAGNSVSAAGDVDGDGDDDLVVGSPLGVFERYSGAAYVVLGGGDGFPSEFGPASPAACSGGLRRERRRPHRISRCRRGATSMATESTT